LSLYDILFGLLCGISIYFHYLIGRFEDRFQKLEDKLKVVETEVLKVPASN
jgi:hypothetical protein